MISLPCSSCKKVLEIDDAFAGGVCRCQHCGTIQTVPSSLKNARGPATPSKTLYQRKPREESADPSAGGAGTTSTQAPPRARAAAPVDAAAAGKRPVPALAIAAALAFVLVVILIIWMSA